MPADHTIAPATTTADARPSVLFVCVKNGGKSQMAAALLRKHAGDAIAVSSAGTKPGTTMNAESVASCEAVGASFEGESPKPIDPQLQRTVDRIIVIGAEAQVTPVEGQRAPVETWLTDEPSLRGIEGAERMTLIRDDLQRRVEALASELLDA